MPPGCLSMHQSTPNFFSCPMHWSLQKIESVEMLCVASKAVPKPFWRNRGGLLNSHNMTSAPGLELLLGHPIMLQCEILHEGPGGAC
eukprot:1160460-Pelagomonas_calceolata.AAC.2